MALRFITFDCAGTLVRVHCGIDRLLYQSLLEVAPDLVPALPIFQAMYQARLPEFHAVNLRRSPELGREFWVRLAEDWLTRVGGDSSLGAELQRRVDDLAFGPPSQMFSLFDDTLPCLASLRQRGVTMAIVSNWDYTLHRVVRDFGLGEFFPVVLASLEEGSEKPEARLFEIALEKLGATPEETVHVGDDPLDDIEGATRVGMRSVLIDRSRATGDAIRSLSELEGRLWTD